jgi:phosphatidylinositol-bisphosphatase
VRDRESVANYQMSTREEEFTDVRPFTFFVGTWNVNGQSPGTFLFIRLF